MSGGTQFMIIPQNMKVVQKRSRHPRQKNLFKAVLSIETNRKISEKARWESIYDLPSGNINFLRKEDRVSSGRILSFKVSCQPMLFGFLVNIQRTLKNVSNT